MTAIASPEHLKAAGKIRYLLSKYQEVELLVRIGEYKQGSDPAADEAISKVDAINNFLKQGLQEKGSFEEHDDEQVLLLDGGTTQKHRTI